MRLLPPRSTRTDTLFPSTTRCLSRHAGADRRLRGGGGVRRRHRQRAARGTRRAARRRTGVHARPPPALGGGERSRRRRTYRRARWRPRRGPGVRRTPRGAEGTRVRCIPARRALLKERLQQRASRRSEENTSELQSLIRISYAVFSLKNKNTEYYE